MEKDDANRLLIEQLHEKLQTGEIDVSEYVKEIE